MKGCSSLNNERKWYVPSAPVKTEEAKLIRKIMGLDIRFLHGCGLKWNDNAIKEEDPCASHSIEPGSTSCCTRRGQISVCLAGYRSTQNLRLEHLWHHQHSIRFNIFFAGHYFYKQSSISCCGHPLLPWSGAASQISTSEGCAACWMDGRPSLQAPHELWGIALLIIVMLLRLLTVLIVLCCFFVLSCTFVLSGGQESNTLTSVLRLVPRGPLPRFRKRNKPRDRAKPKKKIQTRGWCISSMTSCCIAFWPPCVVRTARTAWHQQALRSSSIFWLDGTNHFFSREFALFFRTLNP